MKMISREDLKQRVMGHFCGSCSVLYKDADILELGEYCCDMILDTIAFIDGLPTIEAQPIKRGKWLINCDGYYPYCSNCKEEPQGREMTDFCPNCGCYMREDGESDG